MNTSSILALTLTEAVTTHKKVAVVIDYQEAPSRKPLHTDSVVQLGYAVRMPQLGDTGPLSERIESARLARTGVEMVEDSLARPWALTHSENALAVPTASTGRSVVQLGYAVRMPQLGDTGPLSERIESARLARTGVEMVEDTNGCLEYAAGSEPTVGDLVDAHNRDASLQITEAPKGAEIEIYA